MYFKGTFAIENLATSRAGVREAAEEMSTFNVVPHIGSPAVGEDLADGAEIFVALRVSQEELVQVCGVPDPREVRTCAATMFMRPHPLRRTLPFCILSMALPFCTGLFVIFNSWTSVYVRS